jgi:hypothetical protein
MADRNVEVVRQFDSSFLAFPPSGPIQSVTSWEMISRLRNACGVKDHFASRQDYYNFCQEFGPPPGL